MTERDAIRAVMIPRYRVSFCLHNYTPLNWWECDVFQLTDSGYFKEYEIKLSVADYRADRLKGADGKRWGAEDENKHQFLATGSSRGPCEFHFVVPAGMLMAEPIPDWAGVIELHARTDGHGWYPQTTVKAPRLHREKANPVIEPHARGICYWRMHDLLNR